MFFWVRAFSAKLSKKGNFGPPPESKIGLITEKLIFGYFQFFLLFLFSLFFLFFLLFFFGGFKGQVRWLEGPPHLALNLAFVAVVFFEGSRVRRGGPKGHLTWP